MLSLNNLLQQPDRHERLLKTVAEYGDILARRDRAWIDFILATGIRIGTMVGLTVGDVQTAMRQDPKYLDIRKAIAKRGKGYRIFLPKRAIKAIRSLLKIRKEMGCINHPDQHLVVGLRRKPVTVRALQDRFAKWAKKAGMPQRCSPHWLRHTRAMRILEISTVKEPLRQVMSALGHSRYESVLHYTMPTPYNMQQVMEESQ